MTRRPAVVRQQDVPPSLQPHGDARHERDGPLPGRPAVQHDQQATGRCGAAVPAGVQRRAAVVQRDRLGLDERDLVPAGSRADGGDPTFPGGRVVDDDLRGCAGAGAHRGQPVATPRELAVDPTSDVAADARVDVDHREPSEPALVAGDGDVASVRRDGERRLSLPPRRVGVLGPVDVGEERSGAPPDLQPAGAVVDVDRRAVGSEPRLLDGAVDRPPLLAARPTRGARPVDGHRDPRRPVPRHVGNAPRLVADEPAGRVDRRVGAEVVATVVKPLRWSRRDRIPPHLGGVDDGDDERTVGSDRWCGDGPVGVGRGQLLHRPPGHRLAPQPPVRRAVDHGGPVGRPRRSTRRTCRRPGDGGGNVVSWRSRARGSSRSRSWIVPGPPARVTKARRRPAGSSRGSVTSRPAMHSSGVIWPLIAPVCSGDGRREDGQVDHRVPSGCGASSPRSMRSAS